MKIYYSITARHHRGEVIFIFKVGVFKEAQIFIMPHAVISLKQIKRETGGKKNMELEAGSSAMKTTQSFTNTKGHE